MLYIRHFRYYFRTMFSSVCPSPQEREGNISPPFFKQSSAEALTRFSFHFAFSFISPDRNAQAPVLIIIKGYKIWSLISRTSLPHTTTGAELLLKLHHRWRLTLEACGDQSFSSICVATGCRPCRRSWAIAGSRPRATPPPRS